MDSPEMIRTRGNGIDIQLALWSGEGRAIMCVHGLTANCRCWDTMAASLAPRHKLIALDLRGRGLSEKPTEGYYVEQHCRDIGAVIENFGIERPILMGHSLGALIALVFLGLGLVVGEYVTYRRMVQKLGEQGRWESLRGSSRWVRFRVFWGVDERGSDPALRWLSRQFS